MKSFKKWSLFSTGKLLFGLLFSLLICTQSSQANADTIHACITYTNGNAACANGSGVFSSSPSWVELSTGLGTRRTIEKVTVDRDFVSGYGVQDNNSPRIFQWQNVTSQPESYFLFASVRWYGTAINGTGDGSYSCGIDNAGDIFCYRGRLSEPNNASVVMDSGNRKFKHLALANSHIWAIADDNSIWYKDDYSSGKNDWVQLPGALLNISVDYKTNTICGNNSDKNIFCADWPGNKGSGASWRQIAGAANSVSVYDGKMWVVGTNNSLYYKPDTTTAGNWISQGNSNVSHISVSGTGTKNAFTWTLKNGQYLSYTANKQDIQCPSNNGRDCIFTTNLREAQESSTPLSCGAMHQNLYGITGYDNPDHWCYKAANGWKWSTSQNVYWRFSNNNVQCAAADGRNCKWGNHNLESIVNDSTNPLSCGLDHQTKYGNTGYGATGHWCRNLALSLNQKDFNPVACVKINTPLPGIDAIAYDSSLCTRSIVVNITRADGSNLERNINPNDAAIILPAPNKIKSANFR